MKILDSYAHVALPRFMSADEFLRVMDDNDVESAMLCTAETCPDLAELSRAIVNHPGRFRSAGLPLGDSPANILDSVKAQLDSGFIGIRLPDTLASRQPEILDALGQAGGIPFMVGSDGFRVAAEVLHGFLERYPGCVVCAPHFAAPSVPSLFDSDQAVRRLFSHPRFLVIFSRQGAFEPGELLAWTRALTGVVGWDRIMYGSEYPVALYRDESYASTVEWIDNSGLSPDAAQKDAYLRGNALKHIFSRPAAKPAALAQKWCRMDLKRDAPVWLFRNPVREIPEGTNRKILEAFMAQGGEKAGSYRDFVTRFLAGSQRMLS